MNNEPNPKSSGAQGPQQGPDPLGSSDAANKPFGNDENGILKVPSDAGANASETLWMREQHNANHALWYFSMIIHCLIYDKPQQNNEQKTERILAHLSCLREFAREDRREVKLVIEQVFNAVLTERPNQSSKWAHFIYVHWNLLQNFERQFGHSTCFPDSDYRKIADMVHRTQMFKKWWWGIRLAKWQRKLQQRIKETMLKTSQRGPV